MLAFQREFIKSYFKNLQYAVHKTGKILVEAGFSVIGIIGTAEGCTYETVGTEHVADAAPLSANPAYSRLGQACVGHDHRGS